MSDQSELPYEYGFARIGSTMNYLTREFNPLLHAFDMSKINAIKRLETRQPEGNLLIEANSFSSSQQNSSAFATDNNVRVGFPFCKTSLGFHMSKSEANLNSSKGLQLSVEYALRGYDIVISENITRDELYDCATPKFKEAFDKIITAKTIEKKQKAYFNFQREFGDGFITKLKLISAAVGELEVRYDSEVHQDQQKHGMSVSLGARKGPVSGGASNAEEWEKNHSNSKSSGTISAKVRSIPGVSKVADWANNFISTYANKQLDIISQSPPSSIPMPSIDVKAPEIPTVEAPKKEGVPKPTITLDSTEKFLEYMRMQEMKENDKKNLNWKNFAKQFDEDMKNANANNVVKENLENKKQDKEEDKKNKKSISSKANSVQQEIPTFKSRTADSIAAISFGEYDVYDFEFKSYSDYFPELLPKVMFKTRASLNIAEINMYLMTRQLIGAYFNYVSELPTTITGGYISPDRAAAYERTLKEYSSYVYNNITKQRYITDELRTEVIAKFDKMLSVNKNFAPIGMPVYNYFDENYSVLSQAAFGFVLTAFYKEKGRKTRLFAKRYDPEITPSPNGYIINDNIYSRDYFRYFSSTLSAWEGLEDDYQDIVNKSIRFIPIIHGGEKPGIVLATYIMRLDEQTSDTPEVKGEWNVFWKHPDNFSRLISKSTIELMTLKQNDFERFHFEIISSKGTDKSSEIEYDLYDPNVTIKAKYADSDNYLPLYLYNSKAQPGQLIPLGTKKLTLDPRSYGSFFEPEDEKIDAEFIPVDYDLVGEGSIVGIPMWYQFNFDLLKESIHAGIEETQGTE